MIKQLDHRSESECGSKCTDSEHAAGQETDKCAAGVREDSPQEKGSIFDTFCQDQRQCVIWCDAEVGLLVH